mmetsp:Transcript_25430/g.41004  ORF Transcript_25430/g.41004 Transcript_25430/m.41004 type:complete len:737 (+) Transcript_25430:126-2336(+)
MAEEDTFKTVHCRGDDPSESFPTDVRNLYKKTKRLSIGLPKDLSKALHDDKALHDGESELQPKMSSGKFYKPLAHLERRNTENKLDKVGSVSESLGAFGFKSRLSVMAKEGAVNFSAVRAVLKLPAFKGMAPKSAGNREYSWILQKGPKEVFPGKLGDLSARGVSHRTDTCFIKEINLLSTALSTGTTKMTKQEAFRCFFNRAYAFARLDKNEKALRDYTSAIRIMPSSAPSYFNRSIALIKLGRYSEALRDLSTAIEIDPANRADYYHNRALLNRKIGLFSQSMGDYERAEEWLLKSLGKKKEGEQSSSKANLSYSRMPNLQCVEKDSFNLLAQLLKTDPEYRDDKVVEQITHILSHRVPLKHTPIEILQTIARLARFKTYQKDTCVYKEGANFSSVYLSLSGELVLRKKNDNKSLSKEETTISKMLESSLHLLDGDSSNNVTIDTDGESVAVGHIYPGNFFGMRESSEVRYHPLSAKVVHNELECLVFERNRETAILVQEFRTWQIGDVVQGLRTSAIFSHWGESDLYKAAELATVRHFAPGSTLIKQGDWVTNFFVLRRGVCSVEKRVDVSHATETPLKHPIKSADYTTMFTEAKVMLEEKRRRRKKIKKGKKSADHRDFEVGVLTGGQVAGEFAILESHLVLPSPLTIKTTTMLEAITFSRDKLQNILALFYGESMARIRKNLRITNMPVHKVNNIYIQSSKWEREKTRIVLSNVKMNNRLRRCQSDYEKMR